MLNNIIEYKEKEIKAALKTTPKKQFKPAKDEENLSEYQKEYSESRYHPSKEKEIKKSGDENNKTLSIKKPGDVPSIKAEGGKKGAVIDNKAKSAKKEEKTNKGTQDANISKRSLHKPTDEIKGSVVLSSTKKGNSIKLSSQKKISEI